MANITFNIKIPRVKKLAESFGWTETVTNDLGEITPNPISDDVFIKTTLVKHIREVYKIHSLRLKEKDLLTEADDEAKQIEISEE